MANALALGCGTLIVAITVAITATRYGKLPDRVPIHFGIDGTVNGYGPRYTVWAPVLLQLIIAFISARHFVAGSLQGMLIAGDALLAICLAAQVQIISAALGGRKRISTLTFWLFFAAMIAVAVIAAH